jgi:hypothetical protein
VSYPREAGTIPAGKCACGHWARADEVTECRYCDCAQHRASPYGGHDPQTPPGAEAALQAFSRELDEARQALAAARNAELDAKTARDKVKRKFLLSPHAPAVGVFGGVRTTMAERDAWVADQIADEEQAYQVAKLARQAAKEHLDTLREQGSLQQSISRSVSASYQGTGERW